MIPLTSVSNVKDPRNKIGRNPHIIHVLMSSRHSFMMNSEKKLKVGVKL